MVKWVFDNPYIKRNYSEKLKTIWRKVITMPTPELTIQVYYPKARCWTEKMQYWYRYDPQNQDYTIHHYKAEIMYATMILPYPPEQMSLVRNNGGIRTHGLFCYSTYSGKRIIKLYYSETTPDYWIAFIMAHEYRHYWQMKKYGKLMYYKAQRDANKWAYKRLKEIGFKHDTFISIQKT